MNKRKFNRIKKENPEWRIAKRTLEYQNTRDNLAKVLKQWKRNSEKSKNGEKFSQKDFLLEKEARKDYLVEKVFSKDPLTEEDYNFIIELPKEDLEEFIWKIIWELKWYKESILWMSEVHEDDPYDADIDAFVAWNKLLEYIAGKRDDVKAEKISIHAAHTHVEV